PALPGSSAEVHPESLLFAPPPGSASMSCDGGLGSTTTDVRLPIEQLLGAAAPQIPLEEPGFLTEIRLGVDSASVPRSDREVWLPQSPSAPNVTAQAPESEPQSRLTRKQAMRAPPRTGQVAARLLTPPRRASGPSPAP